MKEREKQRGALYIDNIESIASILITINHGIHGMTFQKKRHSRDDESIAFTATMATSMTV